MLKVVIDTNVFISGLLNRSRSCRNIIQKLPLNEFKFFISPEGLEELVGVLSRPKFHQLIDRSKASKLLETIHAKGHLIKPSCSINLIKDDPTDNRFLEIASDAKADFIVSGDKHLLSLQSFRSTRIIPPSDFLKLLK